jgi:hypothetical protein
MADDMMRRPRLSGRQFARTRGLLPMEYRPTELARVIGCHRSTIYESYIPNGLPHRVDSHGYYWIVGTDCAAWARTLLTSSSIQLGDGEAFCLRCQAAVTIQEPVTRIVSKCSILVRGTRPQCFGTVARFERVEEAPSD